MKNVLMWLGVLFPSLIISQTIPVNDIQNLLDKSIDGKQVFGTAISIEYKNKVHHFAAGEMNEEDQYFIASITKLYTAAVLFKLVDEQKINLSDPIVEYLSPEIMSKLHVYKGVNYSNHITIKHLVTNTSGISDYFAQSSKKQASIFDDLLEKGDTSLSFDQMMDLTKQLSPHFPPGKEGKAYYSDGNFQLLGRIIQEVTGQTMEQNYAQYIYEPLGLTKTYLYKDVKDSIPARMFYKSEELVIPKMMSSFQADGGIVSTTEENLIYLKAHINGELFDKNHINNNPEWNKIYSPFQYGMGMMKFKFVGMPEMIGHSGANGSFAYYIPSRDIYITGTINQVDKPQQAYQLLAKILAKIPKE